MYVYTIRTYTHRQPLKHTSKSTKRTICEHHICIHDTIGYVQSTQQYYIAQDYIYCTIYTQQCKLQSYPHSYNHHRHINIIYVSTTTTQCTLLECKYGFANGSKEKEHRRTLQWVKPPHSYKYHITYVYHHHHHHHHQNTITT